jgi:xanthine/CO dehydrogenase XdhC/CoxF family maturation factor
MGKPGRRSTPDNGLGGVKLLDRSGVNRYWGPGLYRVACPCGAKIVVNYEPVDANERLCGACGERIARERRRMQRRINRAAT